MENKLKTWNDIQEDLKVKYNIDTTIELSNNKINVASYAFPLFILRQEAIKHIKYLQGRIKEDVGSRIKEAYHNVKLNLFGSSDRAYMWIDLAEAQIEWIQYFFDIKTEDLKDDKA